MAANPPDLLIATEKVCFVVVKAREFDAKDAQFGYSCGDFELGHL
jgi:hypothetical protein